MLADFVSGLALIAMGGFLIILALPGRRRRRAARGSGNRELLRQARHVMTVVTFGAGLLTVALGLVMTIMTIMAMAGFEIGLV